MPETKKTYYDYTIERYRRDGENMIIWSIYNGQNIDRTMVQIKDMDETKIKECIRKSKNHKAEYVRKARVEILNDVIVKRRKQKIEKICSKLETK